MLCYVKVYILGDFSKYCVFITVLIDELHVQECMWWVETALN